MTKTLLTHRYRNSTVITVAPQSPYSLMVSLLARENLAERIAFFETLPMDCTARSAALRSIGLHPAELEALITELVVWA